MRIILALLLVTASMTAVGAFGGNRARCLLQLAQGPDGHVPDGHVEDSRLYWASDQPVQVPLRTGGSASLTYSFDIELPVADAYKLIMSDVAAARGLNRVATRYNYFTVQELASVFNFSEKQTKLFALRRGVDLEKTKFLPTDLNPWFFAVLLENDEHRWSFYPKLMHGTEKVLRRRSYPIRTHFAGEFPEVTHETFDDVPVKFLDTLTGLEKQFQAPQTHLHLGIPSEAVSPSEALAIARAVETRVVLRLARKLPEEIKHPKQTGHYANYEGQSSTLKGFQDRWNGPVYLKPNEFKTPVVSHDLEIREFDGLDHGLDLLAMAAKMAKNRDRLIMFDETFGDAQTLRNDMTGNLSGALAYAARILQGMKTAKKADISMSLIDFSRQVTANGGSPSPKLRRKISKFLADNDIESLLTVDRFLK